MKFAPARGLADVRFRTSAFMSWKQSGPSNACRNRIARGRTPVFRPEPRFLQLRSCNSAPALRSLFDVTGTTLRRALPDLDARIAAGDLAPVLDWLRTNVWSQLRPRGGTPTNWRAGPAARYARPGAAHLESRYLADASR
jgi:hypothetical protein